MDNFVKDNIFGIWIYVNGIDYTWNGKWFNFIIYLYF